MTYRGHIKNGVVVLDKPAKLPDGTPVRVQTVKKKASSARRTRRVPTLAERLAPFIGKLEGLPPDLSKNHDHYLYGTPKRK